MNEEVIGSPTMETGCTCLPSLAEVREGVIGDSLGGHDPLESHGHQTWPSRIHPYAKDDDRLALLTAFVGGIGCSSPRRHHGPQKT